MIASAELEKDGKTRHFLKMGRTATQSEKFELSMVTTDKRLSSVIDFINKHGPTDYDYPVADIMVEPVTKSDTKYTKWVKYQTREGAGFKYSDKETDVDPNASDLVQEEEE